MEIIIIEKSTFNVLNFKNCLSITKNMETRKWNVVIDSQTRYYDVDVYDVRIIG